MKGVGCRVPGFGIRVDRDGTVLDFDLLLALRHLIAIRDLVLEISGFDIRDFGIRYQSLGHCLIQTCRYEIGAVSVISEGEAPIPYVRKC